MKTNAALRISFRLSAVLLLFLLLFPLSGCVGTEYHTARVYSMGTLCTLTVEGERGEDGDKTPDLVPLLSEVERLLSHKTDGSVPHLLNTLGYATVTDEKLRAELAFAEEIKAKTGGLFSVSVLPVSRLWNFDAESPVPPSAADISHALLQMEDSALVFGGDLLRKTGGDVDLGALGKGYAADVLAEALRALGESGLVAVGGSIAAVGTKGGNPWQVGVRDPFSASSADTLGVLSLSDAFVSTSGSYEKCFDYGGVRYHHILDPRTGMPARSDLLSVTVVAGKGTLTDVLSTACFLVGADAAFALASEYGASLIAVTTDGTLLVSEGLREIFRAEHGWEVLYR